eukprot:TRINITY_DN1218_c0_g2_i1.p1 TRINITY_DN1218_c0_g2~~TRINITY_DN1218_c0_g2_i1.p1  ORF type:complete len:429 (+),score=100.89 TRINITY_DN1218_c0_g2_i1:23-1288(+)
MSEPTLRIITASEIPSDCAEPVDPKALQQAQAIVDDIKKGGDAKAREWGVKLGDIKEGDSLTASREEMKAAYDAVDSSTKEVLERMAGRIKKFADAQRNSIQDMTMDIPGGKAGHKVAPVESAGCYAPGGRYPLPSSAMMTSITARAAGVKNVTVASPRPSDITLASAYIAGADSFIKVGGAIAITMFAEGMHCPPCDVIVGPGNKWVTAAKSIVQGKCAIDMLAGPSEVLVICDDTCDAKVVAADLLAQAEHDVESRPILITTSKDVVTKVNEELVKQLNVLPTKDTAREAVKKGFAVIVDSMQEAVKISDAIGPEHLEIQTENSQEVADMCDCYGGLFIGKSAAEVLGDYGAGPNHVLPTGGTARYTGGLSVFNFLRIRTWMNITDPSASQQLVTDSVCVARLEGLEGHARAAEARLLE